MTLTISPAQVADADDLLTMIAGLAAFHDDISLADRRVLDRDVFCDPPWLHVLIARLDRQAAGYVALTPVAQLQFGLRGMEIHHLFTTDTARGTGVGSALMDAALSHARGLGAAYLSVGTHVGNAAAQTFYARRGFEPRPAPGPRFRKRLS
ncbi:GNAT family N-acetyltransferase [Mesobacterium sp. TK19101]|uniref:GNAT family N-acetyltransferase n=1 Tax=Mesobacterium hydrothermale TaxID=3111907 RepID=A0ABU6HGG4_9RHOB|nr:GNAT family N-acetyltransferase [Mesobacterium sp. TK19101]MEC3860844.1 GNAT family N-acetyltransferase [Mesobacterium sp. TK19101]